MSHMYRQWDPSKEEFHTFELPVNGQLYIGRVDLNGKPAFEGDIIEFISLYGVLDPENTKKYIVKGVIVMDKGRAGVVRRYSDGISEQYQFWFDGEHEWFSMEQLDSLVIIGNMNQNPEMVLTEPEARTV